MPTASPAPELHHAGPDRPARYPRGFSNPYFHIILNVVLAAAAQVFLKKGADESATLSLFVSMLMSLRSLWTWAGILCIIGSLLAWLHALRFVPLIIAFNVAGLLHVVVPLVSWLFLGETLSVTRCVGIALVFFGVLVVVKPVIKMEEL
ncbi:MAG: hypothetical protein ACFUZC_18075 [Chthoniobacteraceae bacterium]